jgi:hypothetical protein
MLTDELRKKLIKLMQENPQEAMKELQKDPKLLEILLNNDSELKKTKEELNNERIKYVNMTSDMQVQLRQKAADLKTTQGLLIGAGVLFLLSLLGKK